MAAESDRTQKPTEELTMVRVPINPGTVDWSGENPGMYLKEAADGPFVTLISFFRVVLSPHGRGHAAFIFQDPHGDGKDPRKPNACYTDSETLARYLLDNFVSCFLAFRGVAGVSNFRYEKGRDFVASGDARTTYTERFKTDRGGASLTWEPLGEAFMVKFPMEKSPTGRHEMFSLFVNASGVRVSVNGQGVAGRPFPRDVLGKQGSTAFLAFSETWVRR
jgi:hypothetical protein